MSGPGATADREFIARWVRWGIIGVVATAVVFVLLWVLKSALTPLAAAFALAYLIDPLIDRFEERGVPRPAAIFALLAALLTVMLVAAVLILPKLSAEIAGLSERLPGYIDGALAEVGPRIESWIGVTLPSSLREGIDNVRAGDYSIPLESVRGVLERALRSLTGTVGALIGLVVIPVLAYYALVEFDRIRAWFLELVPPRFREPVAQKTATINELISGFIRGQLIVCTILAVLYAVGFSVIGIDLAVVIGLIAGVLAIIPYVGSAVALMTASAMSLLQFGLDAHLLMVVGWYAVIQTLEGMVLTPRIVGQSVGIHPASVIVGLLIGGDLLGFLGLIVAVPLTAVVQVFVRDLVQAYRNSALYTA